MALSLAGVCCFRLQGRRCYACCLVKAAPPAPLACTCWFAHRASLPLQGDASQWAPLLRTLPLETLSPILWGEQELEELLKGSQVWWVPQGAEKADGVSVAFAIRFIILC